MLDEQSLRALVAKGETVNFEAKREFSTDAARRTLVAFANDYQGVGGGTLVIGVTDEGKISGCDDADAIQRRVSGICRDGATMPPIYPQVYTIKVADKNIVVADVSTSPRRPHRANNICYIRVGSETVKATPAQEFEIVRLSGRYPYDLTPVREARSSDINWAKFREVYLPAVQSPEAIALNGRTPEQQAEHLRLLLPDAAGLVPTVATLLVLGLSPQEFLSYSGISFARFAGMDRTAPLRDQKELRGAVDELIDRALASIELHTRSIHQLPIHSVTRTDIYEYPLPAIREAIANAVIHRDYETAYRGITVAMFDDHLEIVNPGGLFGVVNAQNFGTGLSDFRNPNLATMLKTLGYVEKWGIGIPNIYHWLRTNGSPEPRFEFGENYVRVVLPAHSAFAAERTRERESMRESKRI